VTQTRRRGWLTTAALALALASGGCGAPGTERASSAGGGAQDAAAPGAPEEGKRAPAAREGGEPAGGAGAPARLQAQERSIVYTGTITVQVPDVDAAAARAVQAATRAGGLVGADKRSRRKASDQATLQLRVPAARFGAVVDEIGRLGEEHERQIDTEDVTEALVDLDARLASQQASVNRTRALLAQARTVGEIVSVEGELAKREAELASLQARKRRMADLTSLSTITVTLHGPDAAPAGKQSTVGFASGLRAGWTALLASLALLTAVFGALLPWLVVVGVPTTAAVWLARRTGRRRTSAES